MIREVKDAMCVIDSTGCIIWANAEYKSWFFPDGRTAIGKNINTVLPGATADCTKGIVLPFTDHDGKKHYIEVSCEPINDEAGNLVSSAVMFKDVTLMQTLLNISVMTVGTASPESLLEKAISTIAEVFGYRTIAALLRKDSVLELAASRGYSPVLKALLARQHISPDERGMAGRSAFYGKPITREIKAGTISPLLLAESQRLGIRWATTIPIADHDGLLGVLAISTSTLPDTDELGLLQIVCNQISVSMRKILFEEELISARNELELYVDIMGHDITNSLQISLGYLELLRRQTESGEKDYATCAINSLLKINTLINSVSKIRKVRAGKLGSVQLKAAVDGAIHNVRCIAGMMDKEVEIKSEVEPGIMVNANDLIRDMIYNVLESIVSRIASGGSINIRATANDRECTLIIEDTGPGVEQEARAIFASGALMGDRIGRMNMGLYFVKNILKSYGGDIHVEDRVPGSLQSGDRFIVKLKKSQA